MWAAGSPLSLSGQWSPSLYELWFRALCIYLRLSRRVRGMAWHYSAVRSYTDGLETAAMSSMTATSADGGGALLFHGLNPQFVLAQTSPRCLAVVLRLHTAACHRFHPRRRHCRHASACWLGFGYHYHPGQWFCRLEYNTQRYSCRGQLLRDVPFYKLPLLAFKPWSTESILEVQRVFANVLVSLFLSLSLSLSLSLCWSLSLSLPL